MIKRRSAMVNTELHKTGNAGFILTMGEILVEILATERGQSFRQPGTLIGPYASGAPAIFIDQVAKTGSRCAMIGCVGDDDFGALNVDRLRADGVDVSGISVIKSATTGSAFVTYRENGSATLSTTLRTVHPVIFRWATSATICS